MMNPVHARRHDQPHEETLDAKRKPRVAVMEQDRREEDRLTQPERLRIDADDDHLRRADRNRKRQLAEVKAQSRRGVEIAIDVMDEMESPDERHAVTRPMPPPQRVVEQDDRQQPFEPAGPLHQLQKSDAIPHDPSRNRLQKRRLHERHEGKRDAAGREVADDPPEFRFDRVPEWSDPLRKEHQTADDDDDRGRDGERRNGAKLLRELYSGRAHAWSLLAANRRGKKISVSPPHITVRGRQWHCPFTMGFEMARRTSSQPQRSPVIAAMQNLRPSGEHSFEEFIARLLSKVSRERIRRCKAGSQGGVDAIAEIPFAIENKRYEDQLKTRDLLGGLSDAVGTYPDLQLWVLAATCAVSAQPREAVIAAGERQGIAVLILDATASEPDLPGVGGLAALAATDVDFTMTVLADRAWREKGRKPNLSAIETGLREIREMSSFGSWEERLRRDLRDLPTWHRLVRSQNEQLRSLILNSAGNAFGTPYVDSKAVPRMVEAELTNWVQVCTGTATCEIAVVTGDRYDGKTTLVYRWLSQNLQRLPIPVFFLSSRAVQSVDGDVEGLVLREARKALGNFAAHASSLIERQRSREDGGAWCLIILDGANEYVTNRHARSVAVLWGQTADRRELQADGDDGAATASHHLRLDRAAMKTRGRALLVTCRTRDFEEDSSWLGSWPTVHVRLSSYDDQEFADALARRSLALSDVAGLPASAAAMIRHPRYLDLMLRHRTDLGQFSTITADVLHYLDAEDKVPSDARLNADAFKAFLAGLAATWKQEQRLNYTAVRKQVREVTDNVDASMAILLSEGVLTRESDGLFVPDPERLALGMGLFIRESLLRLPENEQAEKLKDILEPNADDDEKVRWLRAAVTTSVLVGDSHKHPSTVDLLLTTWLTSRNFSQRDLEDVKSLSPLLIEAVLRVVSRDFVDNRVLVIAQAMIETEIPRRRDLIATAIRQWFRLVPVDSAFHSSFDPTDTGLHSEDRDEAHRLAVVISDESLADLQLRLTGSAAGRSVRTRHRLGLSIACRNSLDEPIDLLALVAARGVTHWNFNDGERFALRILLASVGRYWFENVARLCEANPDTLRATFVSNLIHDSKRADLGDLQAKLPTAQRLERPATFGQADLRLLDDTQDAKETLRRAKRAAALAVDPTCAPPPRVWRLKLAKTALARFVDSPKPAGRSTTLDSLDLDHLEPALAAWAPRAGAKVIRAFLNDIPRRIEGGETSWSWGLEENAALLTRDDRRELLDVIRRTPAKEANFEHALRRAYLCVMAAESSAQRLQLLLDHPFSIEWTEFYEVLASTDDDELLRRTVLAVREEADPRRLKRARYFLANQGGWEATTADLARLISHISGKDKNGDRHDAARKLLRCSRIATTTPAIELGSLVRVAGSLSEEAWQYEAFLDTKRNPGLHGAKWVARARSAPLTARHNGAKGKNDDALVAAGIERFAARVKEQLTRDAFGHSEQFPKGIAEEISDSAFDDWVGQLIEAGERQRRVDAGVLVPTLWRALKTRHPAAKELWDLAYPFQRSRVGFNQQFDVGGIDWTLVDINNPAIDDGLAAELLRNLVIDCRSNSELVSIAIGARLESLTRLTGVVEALLDSDKEADRARARFIGGWMPEDVALRQRLSAADPSHWVDRIGENAIERLDRERWSREWLERFLNEKRRPQRWAAGRLFLACSDAATPFWVDDIFRESQAPSPRLAEGVMLTGRIRKRVEDNELRDTFLGYSVRDLSDVVPPWHEAFGWEDIDLPSHQGA
jgi:GGDEF domain-containing protein